MVLIGHGCSSMGASEGAAVGGTDDASHVGGTVTLLEPVAELSTAAVYDRTPSSDVDADDDARAHGVSFLGHCAHARLTSRVRSRQGLRSHHHDRTEAG